MKRAIKPEEIEYTALFVDNPQKLLQMFPAKHSKIFAHHSTNWHRPISLEGLEIGKKSLLKIIGQAYDQKGFAVLVENSKSKNKFPHITISCAEGVAPVYSNELLENSSKNGSLEMFKEPFFIEVTEGYFAATSNTQKTYDCIVVGGGQAGLACGYYLKEKGLSFVILDKAIETGSSWRNRYDSLTLFTPNRYCQLPGASLPGAPEKHSTKNEIADYIKKYTEEQKLPINLHEEVLEIKYENNLYEILTSTPASSEPASSGPTPSSFLAKYKSKSVIIATGPFQVPFIPSLPGIDKLTSLQIHSAHYKNPSQVRGEKVLVVGGGNSGAQIAEELAQTKEVYFSAKGHLSFIPQKILGKNIFWWLEKLNFLYAPKNSLRARLLNQSEPIIGTDLKRLIKEGRVTMLGEALGADTEKNEVIFESMVGGQDLDKLDKVDKVGENHHRESFDTIIWATGYRQNYDFIKIPGITDEKGALRQEGGVVSGQSGLYCIGQIWQRTRSSALVGGVGRDARKIVEMIASIRL